MDETDRRECLETLARRLGLEGIPDAVADELPELEMRQAYYGGEEEWGELEVEARRLLRLYHRARGATVGSGRGRQKGEAPREIEIALDPYTLRHGEVLAELAAARLDVRTFRRKYLPDGLLSEDEYAAFERGKGDAQSRLRRLSEDLARAYGWRTRQARRFVVTGRAPAPVYVSVATGSTPPVAVGIQDGSDQRLAPPKARVTVEADAWVDAGEVARAFRAAQRQLLGGSARKRPDRALELVRFVARQIREHGKRPSWEELRVRWNRERPEWKYANRQGVSNTFERFVRPERGIQRPKWKDRGPSTYTTATPPGRG
jgi:hypothetical protein